VPHPCHLAVAALLTQLIWRLNQCTISSSSVEDFAVKTLSLLASLRPSDEPLLHHRFIRCYCLLNQLLSVLNSQTVGWTVASLSVHLVLKTPVLARYFLVQISHRIDRRSNQPDCQFIRCYWFLWPSHCYSSLNHLTVPFCCFFESLTCFLSSLTCHYLTCHHLHNMSSCIASKYIVSPYFCYEHVDLWYDMFTWAWYVKLW
jgi:hypothetical protein